MSKYPAFMFYIGDWMKDPALRAVSATARGVWIDMLCLMFESPRRGYLETATGEPISIRHLSRMTGVSDKILRRSVAELRSMCVCSSTDVGTIFSRRIVRDEERREADRKRQEDHRNPRANNKTGANVTPPVTPPVTPAVTPVVTGVVTPHVTAKRGGMSQHHSFAVAVADASTKTKALKTLVDVPPTQAPSTTSPDVSQAGAAAEVEKPEERRPEDLKLRDGQIIEALFNTYCDELHRDPKKYTLTPIRKAKALLRLHERTKIRGSLALAVDEINTAIKNLAASEYHVSHGYIDWTDQIFRSAEEFEKRLNWVKPNGGKSHGSGYETLDQRNERIFQETLSRMDIDPPEDDGEPETEPDTREP